MSISFSGSVPSGQLDVASFETTTVAQLKKLLADKLQMPNTFKLICKGRVLKEEDWTLDKYGIKANAKILIMKGAEQKEQEKEAEKEQKVEKLEKLKAAVQALSQRTGDEDEGKYYFELEDQSGQKLVIPEADRQALVHGMTLYEKGKACLKRNDYNGALELFLLSDQSFQLVSPKYLELIDNDAHLCLDIVWTFFLKTELKRLYEAEQWLKRAELGFRRSHGPNLERLRRLRNGFCPEKALYVRLHLLQAVVSYHVGDMKKAKFFYSWLSQTVNNFVCQMKI